MKLFLVFMQMTLSLSSLESGDTGLTVVDKLGLENSRKNRPEPKEKSKKNQKSIINQRFGLTIDKLPKVRHFRIPYTVQ